MSTDKVQIRDIKTKKVIEVFAVDAKESVASGRYEYISAKTAKKLGVADWLQDEEVTNDQEEEIENEEGDEDEGENEEITQKEIQSMNTQELVDLVANKELDIENFESLNLKDKRKAVIDAIFNIEEE